MSEYTKQSLKRLEMAAGFYTYTGLMPQDPEILERMLGDNRNAFLEAFGSHLCTYTSEYRHWIWNPLPGVWFLTGPRGTSVEVSQDFLPRHLQSVLNVWKNACLIETSVDVW